MASAGVQIMLDRPRLMKLTFAEIIALENRLGKPSGEIFGDLAKMSFTTLQHVMFASLRHEDKKLRFEAVGELVAEFLEDGHDLGDLMQLVNETVTQSGLFGRGAGRKEDAVSSST